MRTKFLSYFSLGCTRLVAVLTTETCERKNYHFRTTKDIKNILLADVESRTQGSRPKPRTRTQKKFEAKDSLSEDKHPRGQGQGHRRKCSPKRSSEKIFRRSPENKVFQKIFKALHKLLTTHKIVLSSSRRPGNFRGLEASRPRTSKCVLEDVLEANDVLRTPHLPFRIIIKSNIA